MHQLNEGDLIEISPILNPDPSSGSMYYEGTVEVICVNKDPSTGKVRSYLVRLMSSGVEVEVAPNQIKKRTGRLVT